MIASFALHAGLVGLAAVVVPRASARVTDVVRVELVELSVPITEAPPAPSKPLTLPKPIATPRPKLAERAAAPAREPEPAPTSARAHEPASEPTPPPAAQGSAVESSSAPSAATTRPMPGGVSWIDGTTTTSAPPAVASIPPDAVTRVARPSGGYQVRPSYPSTARRLGVQGTTLLRVHVLADGRVGDVNVEQSAGHPDLDHAAADAVRRWRFEPARRGEQEVAMWVRIPVEFRLR